LLEQAPNLDALVAPIGGGGLFIRCAVAAKGVNPKIRVFLGSSRRGLMTLIYVFRANERIEVNPDTIADGLRSPIPGKLTFPDHPRLG
jgi:threonine dehydratase